LIETMELDCMPVSPGGGVPGQKKPADPCGPAGL